MVSGPPGWMIYNKKNKSFEWIFLERAVISDKIVIHENFSEDSIIFSITKKTKLLCAAAESQE
jgi:hypothetical protein